MSQKKFLAPLLIISFLIPQITFASWWNPMSWGWFKKITQKSEVIQVSDIKKQQKYIDNESVVSKTNLASTTYSVISSTGNGDDVCEKKASHQLIQTTYHPGKGFATTTLIEDLNIIYSDAEPFQLYWSIFAKPENKKILILTGSRCSTGGSQYPLALYDIEKSVFKKLNVSEYHNAWNAWRLSPDSTKIVEAKQSATSSQLVLLDLVQDTHTIIKELSEGLSFSSICEMECISNLHWVDKKTIEYGIYKKQFVKNGKVEFSEKPLEVLQFIILDAVK